MEKITGAVPVLETPFTADGSRVDEEDLRAVVEAVIRDGASGLMVFGFATEFAELSDAERERLLEVVLETAAGRILYNRLVPYLNAFHGPHELAFEKRVLVKRGIFKTPFCRSRGSGGEMDAYTEAYLWKYYDYLREQFPQEIA